MTFNNTGKPIITPQDVSALLRDRSRWPDGFKWDYKDCKSCAMGLCQAYFGVDLGVNDKVVIPGLISAKTGDFIGISHFYAERIFISLPHQLLKECDAITPEDVADEIDKLLVKPQQE